MSLHPHDDPGITPPPAPAAETARDAARRLTARQQREGYRPEALHTYHDAEGRELFHHVRLRHPEAGEKWMRPMHRPTPDAPFVLGRGPKPETGWPLYRGRELRGAIAAATPGASVTVFVVEGEKPADALARVPGCIVVTSGGSESAEAADWGDLRNCVVLVWPDHDTPGLRYADDVVRLARVAGASPLMLDPTALGLPPKGDAADWLAAHPAATLADLESLPWREPPAPETTPPTLPPRPPRGGGYGTHPTPPVVCFVRGDEIEPEPIKWLWPGYLACGMLHILAGAPGCGKTMLALAMAATVTTGGRWPDGARCATGGSVAIWSGEDDPRYTLIPRLLLSGADRRRVIFPAVESDGERLAFDPALHLDALAAALAAPACAEVRLLILDPVVSVVTGDSHKNAEVRRALQPLVELAAARGIAVLGITHLTKGTAGRDPVERVNGSLAFGALARVVLMAAKPKAATGPDDPRLFFRAKSNIGPDGGGIEYFLRQGEVEGYPGVSSSFALFGAPLSGSAHELMARAEADPDDNKDRNPSRLDDACEVLRAILADGPVPSTEAIRQAKAAGVKADTLSKARERLGVKARKRPEDGVWIMSLPPDPSGGATADSGQGPEEPEEPEDRQGLVGSVFPRRAGDPSFGLKDHGVFGLPKEPILQIVPILDTGQDAEEWL